MESRQTIEGRENVIRELLIEAETDMELNDLQPMDDGDQKTPSTEPKRVILHKLWCRGDDFMRYWDAFPPFVEHVVRGETAKVRDALKQAFANAYGKTEETAPSSMTRTKIPYVLRQILETRCTPMRLSPLLHCMSIMMVLSDDGYDRTSHVDVATALLRYGARPDAKDVIGKILSIMEPLLLRHQNPCS